MSAHEVKGISKGSAQTGISNDLFHSHRNNFALVARLMGAISH